MSKLVAGKPIFLILGRFLFTAAIFLTSHFAFSQVNVVYNQFFMNPYLYNPAYAGVEGHSVVFGLYKQQWTNIDGAPAIANLNFHTPLKGGVGFGAMVFNETQGPITTSWGKVTSSYLLTVDKEHYLRFGLSIGGGTNSLNFNELDAPTDPAFLNIIENNNFFIGDFGATYHFGHFNVGFSLPNLVTYDVFTPESTSPVRVSPLDNAIFKINYRGHLSDDWAIEPHVIYRYNDVGPDLYEAAVIFHIKHLIWTGASFRQDNNLMIHGGFKIKESLAIGYAFELGNANIAATLGPSHEIHIGYHISSKKHHAEHASSFIKSHRLSAEERAKKAELERERKLAALRRSRTPAASADEDALTIATPVEQSEPEPPATDETRTNEFGENERAITVDKQLNDGSTVPVKTWVPTDTPEEKWEVDQEAPHRERTAPDGTKEVAVEFYRTGTDGNQQKIVKWQPVDPTAQPTDVATDLPASPDIDEDPTYNTPEPVIDPTLTEDFRTLDEVTSSDEPMEVTRGTHLLELPAGNYVIAGAFEVFQHAEDYSDQLFERGFHDTIVGYVSARGYYYVVLYQSENIARAVRQRNRIRNTPDLSNVWVLKVNE